MTRENRILTYLIELVGADELGVDDHRSLARRSAGCLVRIQHHVDRGVAVAMRP